MPTNRFVATPFGVRVDYITNGEDWGYSEYLPGSLAAMPREGRGAPAIGIVMLIMIAFLIGLAAGWTGVIHYPA